MACSVKQNLIDHLEIQGFAKESGGEFLALRPINDMMKESARISLMYSQKYGSNDLPFMIIPPKTLVLNEQLLENISATLENRGVTTLSSEEVQFAEGEVLASMRAVMKKLGISERVVASLKDAEGRPLEGVAAADIMNRTISYLEGAQSELPEEVVHFMVVAMRDLDDPLYRSMAKRIFDEPEYREVVNDPNYQNLGFTQEDIVDEAITKAIVNRIGTQAKQSEDRNTRWWQRALKRLKEIFNMSSDPFAVTLRKMLNDDLEVYADAISNTKRKTIFRSFGENFSQKTIKENLVREHGSLELKEYTKDALAGKIDKDSLEVFEDESGAVFRYRRNGELVLRRATDASSIRFMREIGLESYKEVSSRDRSKLLRETGTNLHEVARQIMVNLIATDAFKGVFNIVDLGYPQPKKRSIVQKESGLTVDQFKELENSVKQLLDDVKASNKDKGKIDFYGELRIFNAAKKTAGTIDMLFVLPNGSAQIYDYKFVSPLARDIKTTATGTPYMVLDPFRGSKGEGYEDQMSFYVETLRREYGIQNITRSRIVPGHVRFKWDKTLNRFTGISYLSMGSNGDKFLMQYPLAKEYSEDEKITAKLKKLYDDLDLLKQKPDSPAVRRERALIVTAVKELLNDSDLSFTIAEIGNLIKYTNELLKITDKEDPRYPEFGELQSIHNLLGTFSHLREVSKNKISAVKKKNKNQGDAMEEALENAEEEVRSMLMILDSRLKSELTKTSKFNVGGISFYNIPGMPMGIMDKLLSMSTIENTIFKDTFDRLAEARSKADEQYRLHYKKWKDLDDNLKKWAGSKGIRDAYNMLIRETPGGLKLITMFRPEFRKEVESVISEGFKSENAAEKAKAIAWMKSRYRVRPEAKKDFLQFKSEYLKRKEKEFAGKTDQRYITAEQYFDNTYNVFNNDNAWISPKYYTFLEVKPEVAVENYSQEYSVMLQKGNEPLLEYYNAWKEDMQKFSKMKEGRSWSADMIPSINKNVMEGIMTGENVFDSISKNIMKNLTIETENEENVGKGMIKRIPLKFVKPPRTESGEVDTTLISRDLTKAMTTFGAHFFEYVEDSKVEGEILFLRSLLFEDKKIQEAVVEQGKIVREAGAIKTRDVTPETKELYDTFINMLLYKQFSSGIGEITVGGTTISGEKLMQGMMSMFSKSILTVPVKAALGTLGSSTLFRISKSVDNPNYSYELLSKSHKLFWSDRKRYMAISEYFDVHQDGERFWHEREFTGDVLTRYTDSSFLYYPLIPADKINDRRLLVAMLHNHAVDKDGLIQRLEDMPEGTKPLAETMEVSKDGKITKELPQSVRHQIKMRFMGEVKGIRGDMSELSVAAYHSNIWLKALMQFKDWMPPMVDDRMGKVRYDIYTGKYTAGRYKMAFSNSLATQEDAQEELAWHAMALNFAGALQTAVATMTWLDDYSVAEKERERRKKENKWSEPQEQRFQRRRAKYLKEWRAVKDSSTDPRIANMPLEKFYELKQQAVRSTMAELRGVAILMLLSMALSMKLDLDDEPDYATRKMSDILGRILLESAMFINPAELVKLGKSPIPLLGLLETFTKLVSNSGDEFIDLLSGEMSEKGDRTQVFHYSSKFVPGMNFIRWGLDIK